MLRRQLQDHEGSTSAFEFKPPKRPTLCAWIPKAKINQILPSGLTIRGLKKESKGRAGSRCTQHLSFTDAFAPNLAANLLMDTGAYDNAILAY
ncbi:hypothetical protein PC118_g16122 [Phytophthora cactorum]|uniref:Uncharacterized protein n=1 Tax=Phytophthora cactorum TaxID=29920 RepID=A0A8T1FNJ2_9STRA|nr:hypothetical protein PC118_g16122 [Phytophthora cactorum]